MSVSCSVQFFTCGASFSACCIPRAEGFDLIEALLACRAYHQVLFENGYRGIGQPAQSVMLQLIVCSM